MEPKTKAPAPSRKLKDERAEALQRMTKAELVRTVKKLDANQTKLLNRIAALECASVPETADEDGNDSRLPNPFDRPVAVLDNGVVRVGKFPWER